MKYQHYSTTKEFAVFVMIYSVLRTIFNSLVLMVLGIIGPLVIEQFSGKGTDVTYVFYHMFLLLYLLLPFCNVKMLESNRRKLICVKVMRMDARKYTFADYFPKEIVRIIIELPAYYFISKYFDLYYPIALLLVVAFILMLCSNEFRTTYVSEMTSHFSYLIFILYIMSAGSNATKAMFYNCDVSLLRYGFYREKSSLLSTFTIRLKHLILTNLVPASLMAVGFLILALISRDGIIELVPIALLIIIVSMFFSVHHLFLYYFFQPYTVDLAVKNPFFSIFNFMSYILCYGCMQIDSAPQNFLLFVVLGTIAYMVVALVLVYKLADKTFRLR